MFARLALSLGSDSYVAYTTSELLSLEPSLTPSRDVMQEKACIVIIDNYFEQIEQGSQRIKEVTRGRRIQRISNATMIK